MKTLPTDRNPTDEEIDEFVEENHARILEECAICGRTDDHTHEYSDIELRISIAGILAGIEICNSCMNSDAVKESEKECIKSFLKKLRDTPRRIRFVVTKDQNGKTQWRIEDGSGDFLADHIDAEIHLKDAMDQATFKRRTYNPEAPKVIFPAADLARPRNGIPPNGRLNRG